VRHGARARRVPRQEIVACNDTRDDLPISFTARDADTGETLAQGSRTVRGDSVDRIASIPHRSNAARFLIFEWTSPLGRGVNHYLSGSPPFRAEDVDRWMDRLSRTRSQAPGSEGLRSG